MYLHYQNNEVLKSMEKRKECLIDGCTKPSIARGLCDADYQTAHYYVTQGKTTWEKLEKKGMADGKAKRRKRFEIHFNKIK